MSIVGLNLLRERIDQVRFFKLIFILVVDEESNSFTSIYKIKVSKYCSAVR